MDDCQFPGSDFKWHDKRFGSQCSAWQGMVCASASESAPKLCDMAGYARIWQDMEGYAGIC